MFRRSSTWFGLAVVLAACPLVPIGCRSRTPGAEAAAATAGETAPEEQDKQPSFGVGRREITIRNVTKETVTYNLRPYGSKEEPERRTLAPDAVDRYPALRTVVITYQKYGRDETYTLTPGRPYSFRYDSAGKIDIWAGAHGREDAADLAPFVPTPPEVVVKMCDLAEVNASSVVYDIGCGDGRIVVYAAKAFGARGVGIDIDPQRIRESKENARRSGVEHLVEFIRADATTVDISAATVVALYLLPESNELLRPKLEKELKPGVPVVTHNYTIPGWEDKEVTSAIVTLAENKEHTVFLYRR